MADVAPQCPTCGFTMKPLFQTHFCDVNECDLPPEKRRKQPEPLKKAEAPVTHVCMCPTIFAYSYDWKRGAKVCLVCKGDIS